MRPAQHASPGRRVTAGHARRKLAVIVSVGTLLCCGVAVYFSIRAGRGAARSVKPQDGESALARSVVSPADAVAREDVGAVDELLRKGLDVSATYEGGQTLLHIAASHGQLQVLRLLLDAGATSAQIDAMGRTALHSAVVGFQWISPDEDHGLLLLPPRGHEHLQVVTTLLRAGAAVDARDGDSYTSLHWAARLRKPEIATVLLEYGANPMATDNLGYTPLHFAVRDSEGEPDSAAFPITNDPVGTVKVLLRYGADPYADGGMGTVLEAAVRSPRALAVVMLLLELDGRNGPANAQLKDGTLLREAASAGNSALVEWLLDVGVGVDQVALDGSTALFRAALGGREEVVRLLLARGARHDLRVQNGATALHAAAAAGSAAIVKLLADAGANMSALDDAGNTALHAAALSARSDGVLVGILMKSGVSINARNQRGDTAFAVAEAKDWLGFDPPILRVLVEHGGGR